MNTPTLQRPVYWRTQRRYFMAEARTMALAQNRTFCVHNARHANRRLVKILQEQRAAEAERAPPLMFDLTKLDPYDC